MAVFTNCLHSLLVQIVQVFYCRAV